MHLFCSISPIALVLFTCISISNAAGKRKRAKECKIQGNCILRNDVTYSFEPDNNDMVNIIVKRRINNFIVHTNVNGITTSVVQNLVVDIHDNDIAIYTALYNRKRRLPVYTAYVFDLINKNADFDRKDEWQELDLPNYDLRFATDNTYKGTIERYHRGHLMPYHDYLYESALDSAYVTDTYFNAAPQVKDLNSGIWMTIEGRVHALILKEYNGIVVTGVCNAKDIEGSEFMKNKKGKDALEVPKCYWKLICFRNESITVADKVVVLGFKIHNSIAKNAPILSCGTALKSQELMFSDVDYLSGNKNKVKFWKDVYSQLEIEKRASSNSLPTYTECAGKPKLPSKTFSDTFCRMQYKEPKFRSAGNVNTGNKKIKVTKVIKK